MIPIRIDENSTDIRVNEVFEMKVGGVFGLAPEFYEEFISRIPRDRCFKILPITEGSPEYDKYGRDCYEVTCNTKLFIID